MPTPQYFRPSMPYVPVGGRNTNRFSSLGVKPATGQELDAEYNAIVDYINGNLVDAIDNIEAGVLRGSDEPDNAGKFVTTDGQGNISWDKVRSDNIEDKTILAENIADKELTADQIENGSITESCLAPDSVTNAKVKDHTITLTKTKSLGHNCWVGGSALDPSYKEIISTADWDIPTIENNRPRCESISTIWNNSAGNLCSGAKLSAGSVASGALADPVFPVGGVLVWSAAALPARFLECDGSAISRATYAQLFAVIGVAFGAGDNATTFNLPDLRGRAVFGNSGASGRLTQGTAGGAEYVTLSVSQMPAHNHSYTYALTESEWDVSGSGYQNKYFAKPQRYLSAGTEYSGKGQHFNNMPPFLVMRYIMRVT